MNVLQIFSRTVPRIPTIQCSRYLVTSQRLLAQANEAAVDQEKPTPQGAQGINRPPEKQKPFASPKPFLTGKSVEEEVQSTFKQSEVQNDTSLWVRIRNKLPMQLTTLGAYIGKALGRGQIGRRLPGEVASVMDRSASQMYYNCANNFPYVALCKEFGLEDTFSAWFSLTLLHTWMCLMKLHVSLDAPAYERFRQTMLTTLWHDVDKRLATLKEQFKDSGFAGKKTMQKLHGIYVSTLIEYDEGFLTDDRELAASVWRNMYLQNPTDPLHLSRVVRYVRGTIAFLDTKDVNDLLVNGVQQWTPAEELVRSRQ